MFQSNLFSVRERSIQRSHRDRINRKTKWSDNNNEWSARLLRRNPRRWLRDKKSSESQTHVRDNLVLMILFIITCSHLSVLSVDHVSLTESDNLFAGVHIMISFWVSCLNIPHLSLIKLWSMSSCFYRLCWRLSLQFGFILEMPPAETNLSQWS